jgi:hypothetical protein
MKSIINFVFEFIKDFLDDMENKKLGGIFIFFWGCFLLWSLSLGGGIISRSGFQHEFPTNFVLLVFFIEIIFSILMFFSIKNDRKERAVMVLFLYTAVFFIFIPFAIEIMERIHEFADMFADEFMVRKCKDNAVWACSSENSLTVGCREIFHWIAFFLPIVLLFAYDLIYLILFRKFENYDKNYAFAKGEILRLSYELEYQKRNSAVYQSFLENDADELKNHLNNFLTDWKFAHCLNSRFVVLNPNIELYRINIQKKDDYDYLNNAFSHLNYNKSYIEKFFMMLEMIFEKREFEKNSDKNYESIRSSGMPLIVSDRFCNIPKWDDDYFFSNQSKCQLLESTIPYIVKDFGSFRILFYGNADKDDEKFKYVIVTFDDFKKVAFSNIAYLLYKNNEDDICVVRFKSGVASDVVNSFFDRGLKEIAEFSYIEHYYAWENIKAKMKNDK